MLDSPGHFLSARVPHRLVATHPVRMVFLDPAMVGGVPTPIAEPVSMLVSQADLLERALARWLEGQGASRNRGPNDERLATILRWLEPALDTSVRVEDAAQAVGLSASRFMHWFAEVSGLPFRAYVRWLRLQRAVRTLADGSTLTEAAHWAGFSDSAHLTRTFVATFGVRPASLRGVRVVSADDAEPPPALFDRLWTV